MNIFDLAQEIGLKPKKVASTRGGEFKSSCPACNAGKDRFCIWPHDDKGGRYWCRICGLKGDAIQFCRDFMGLSYQEACSKLSIEPKKTRSSQGYCPFKKTLFSPLSTKPISKKWQGAAAEYIERCHQKLVNTPAALDLLLKRGFTREVINKFQLGWNSDTLFDKRACWGLSTELKDNGKERLQWLPKGIVIPGFEAEIPVRIKIRRSEWSQTDKLPKYVEISGGLQRPAIYGDTQKPVIIMESELDAILTQQFAADLCCCIALGGVGKRPDKEVHDFLTKASLILLALDYDEAGKKEYPFWMSQYLNLRPWPPTKGKSPGDSYQLHNIDLRQWVTQGLEFLCS